jgi:hypothetical protein
LRSRDGTGGQSAALDGDLDQGLFDLVGRAGGIIVQARKDESSGLLKRKCDENDGTHREIDIGGRGIVHRRVRPSFAMKTSFLKSGNEETGRAFIDYSVSSIK